MDWTHLHLALNHVPVIGMPFVVAMLGAGAFWRSNDVVRFALWTQLLLSAAAIAIKFTGDFAAEESAQRLATSQAFVKTHEEAGDQATAGVFLAGIAAGLALFLARRSQVIRRWTVIVAFVLGLVSTLLYFRSAQSGGKIGHEYLRERKS